jgi:hypothetical protein
MPFLDPIVRWTSGLNHHSSRNVLLVARGVKLKKVKLLLTVKLDAKGAVCYNLFGPLAHPSSSLAGA